MAKGFDSKTAAGIAGERTVWSSGSSEEGQWGSVPLVPRSPAALTNEWQQRQTAGPGCQEAPCCDVSVGPASCKGRLKAVQKGQGWEGAARPGPSRIYLEVSLHPSAFTSPPLKNSWAGNK